MNTGKTCLLIFALFIGGHGIMSTGCSSGNKDPNLSLSDSARKELSKIFYLENYWVPPDTSKIPHDDTGNQIRYGRQLISNTSYYFGPHGTLGQFTNGMNCQNCHLDAGSRVFGNNYSAVASTYPKFRARSGSLETIEKRINDCLSRSLNGHPIDSNSKEMIAMVAYIKWLGKNVTKGETPKGAGLVEVPFSDRAANPEKGKIHYEQKCVSCHGLDGSGKLTEDQKAYLYPPLWGPHSYNTAAGLYRLSRFAGYIKANMPLGASHETPQLSDDEAWDIAAYVNSQPRPDKKFKEDWPDISKKPFDHPFGPYADNFTETQHKYGPFAQMPSARKKK